MNKLARSTRAAALATAAVAAGALAIACGSGAPGASHSTSPKQVTASKHVTHTSQGTTHTSQGTTGTKTQSTGGSTPSTGTGTDTCSVATQAPPAPSVTTLPASAAAPAPAAPTGSQLSASKIPWSEVGPGWTLAIWNPQPVSAHGGPTTKANELLLVDPLGHAYAEDTFPVGTFPNVADWSGSKQDAIVTIDGKTVVVVDLLNGSTVSRFDVPNLQSVSFTHPDGAGLLIEQSIGTPSTTAVARTNLYGQAGLAFADPLGGALYTASGTELVLGAKGGLQVVTNLGIAVASLPVKGVENCTPVDWWGPDQVVADCIEGYSGNDYVVSLTGASPVLLGPGITLPPFNAIVHIGGSVFSNTGACGTIELMKLVKGQWQDVNIPGAVPASSQIIDGSYGNLLEVNATPSCGESQLQQPSLFWYDPTTDKSTLFFGSTHGGGVVYGGLGFPSYPAADDQPLTD